MSGIVGDDGIKDFLQYDQEILDMTCPDDPNITVVGGQELIAITTATGMGETYVDYHWQISKDSGTTWTSASDADKSDLIITGIGYGQTNTADDGSPKFIELYALDDLNLSDYQLLSHKEATSSNVYHQINFSGSLDKGDYILLYYSFQTGSEDVFFENDLDLLYDLPLSRSELRDIQSGDDKFSLRKKK